MNVLGIESTAHTLGISLINSSKKEVILNLKDTYKPEKGRGILPRDAADHHSLAAPELLSKIPLSKVDLISYSRGPGLAQCLMVGSTLAKYLSLKLKKPLIGVNHCVAHLEISRMVSSAKDPVMLYASGGNTQVIAFSEGKYRIFGETLDIPLGNLFDVFGRNAGINFPAGPEIEKLAKKGKLIEIPYIVKGMDVSFSGLLTNVITKYKRGAKLEDLSYSLQETCFAMLVEVSERAMSHTRKKELIISGGVASNKRLQKMCEIMCEERGAKFHPLPTEYAVDNGAMIAWLGYLSYSSPVRRKNITLTGRQSVSKSITSAVTPISAKIIPKWRTDDVEVTWRQSS